jgi:hypothetical protein
VGSLLELSQLRESDAQDVLHFEMENRRYFATYISDRGDDYFAHFPRYVAEDMAEQERGAYRLYLARPASGELIGRINLRDIRLQSNRRPASLGYRIGERFSGQGCATQAVALVCRTAPYELHASDNRDDDGAACGLSTGSGQIGIQGHRRQSDELKRERKISPNHSLSKDPPRNVARKSRCVRPTSRSKPRFGMS